MFFFLVYFVLGVSFVSAAPLPEMYEEGEEFASPDLDVVCVSTKYWLFVDCSS